MRLINKYSSEVAVFNMFLYFTRVYLIARSIILTAYYVWIIETLSAVLRDLVGHCLTSIHLTHSCQFFSQTIHTCHRPSLVRKLFITCLAPIFSLFVDALSNTRHGRSRGGSFIPGNGKNFGERIPWYRHFLETDTVKQHHMCNIPHTGCWLNVGLPVCTVCNKTWLYTTFQNHDFLCSVV